MAESSTAPIPTVDLPLEKVSPSRFSNSVQTFHCASPRFSSGSRNRTKPGHGRQKPRIESPPTFLASSLLTTSESLAGEAASPSPVLARWLVCLLLPCSSDCFL